MSRVVIAARTRMYEDHVCIGGHDLDHRFRKVRLFDRYGRSWKSDSPFDVGTLWEIRYRTKACTAPHVEDVSVLRQRLIGRVPDLRTLLLGNVRPWTGKPEALFEGRVRSTGSGTAYIPAGGPLPSCSTGYWVPEDDLTRYVAFEKVRFMTTGTSTIKRFAWVGVQAAPERIAPGSLVRVSLSRLFRADTTPHGYYVQISGVI